MRKRNCDKLFDNILWYTIYLLPLIVAFLVYRSPELFNLIYEADGYLPYSFGTVVVDIISELGIRVDGGNIATAIYDVLEQLGTTGAETWLASYLGYLVLVYCGHLFVDFLLFIPRLCHKWMNTLTQGG